HSKNKPCKALIEWRNEVATATRRGGNPLFGRLANIEGILHYVLDDRQTHVILGRVKVEKKNQKREQPKTKNQWLKATDNFKL
ncbi:MAG: hypothetical protein ACK2TU_12625, partial [Anaerolineales bacterium]